MSKADAAARPLSVLTLTETEFGILNALRVYRYLTVEQMLRLKVVAQASRLYTVLREVASGASLTRLGRLPAASRRAMCWGVYGMPYTVLNSFFDTSRLSY